MATTLIPIFKDLRNFFAANTRGMTRDTALVEELANLLLARVYDEVHAVAGKPLNFQVLPDDSDESLKARLDAVLRRAHHEFGNPFESKPTFGLDAGSLRYAVGQIQAFAIAGASRDVLGEAFEAFIGPGLRGEEGQFFTPKNVTRMAVALVNPKVGESVIDPACGAGGFLSASLEWIGRSNKAASQSRVVGIDKDAFLARLSRFYMSILGRRRIEVFCENSLAPPTSWNATTLAAAKLGSFDLVITNPPFGDRIPVTGTDLLAQYALGHEWRYNKQSDRWEMSKSLKESEAPQILFVERCLQLLKPGGRMALVLPEGLLGNHSAGSVRQILKEQADIIAIVDCPLETFLPSTPTKTCVIVAQKRPCKATPSAVFMAVAEKVGHDRRGNPVLKADGSEDDDFPLMSEAFDQFRRKHGLDF